MNILFISNVLPRNSHGLSWSVPARVIAQMKYDNVLWVNSNSGTLDHWKKVESFHKLNEYGSLHLSSFPKPFNKPDLVVFEGLYNDFHEVIFAMELKRNNVPYVIVPRSALTYQAMHNHSWLKKKIAHIFFYNRFINNSAALQYLTKQEKLDSERVIRHKSFILPNGFNPPEEKKKRFFEKGIKAIFIGRLVPHQKGLDILFPAIGKIQDFLRLSNLTLDIYGPIHPETQLLQEIINKNGIDDIVKFKGEITGNAKKQVILDSDLFILTSRFEGHPMGLVEALAYGIPSLVTPGTNMKDEIEEYNAGWVTDLSIEGISEKFIDIINSKTLFAEKGLNAQKLALNYNWDVIAQDFSVIAKQLVEDNANTSNK